MLLIAVGGPLSPFKASATMVESHSKITSRTPTSHANITATSKALASDSKGPKGIGRSQLKVAVTLPSLSRIIAPTPAECYQQIQSHPR